MLSAETMTLMRSPSLDTRSALTLAVFFSPFAAPPDVADALLLPRLPIRYLLSEMKKPPWWTAVGRIHRHAYLNCSSI